MRRGKPNTIVNNRTKSVVAERELVECVTAWIREGIEEDLVQREIIMGTIGQKLQESNVCVVGEKISRRGRYTNYHMYGCEDIERKNVDSTQFGR